jgi:hypothetical protein
MDDATWQRRIAASSVFLVLLIFMPVPLLPPLGMAETIQANLGVGWKGANFLAALCLRVALYGGLGCSGAIALAMFWPKPRLLVQFGLVPALLVVLMGLMRAIKSGTPAVGVNAIIPILACVAGAWMGLLLYHRDGKAAAIFGGLAISLGWFSHWTGPSAAVCRASHEDLQRLVANVAALPADPTRWGKVLQLAFEEGGSVAKTLDPIARHRAAILALGIALGHPRLARVVGLDPHSPLVVQAGQVRGGTTLQGREDWVRHFSLSAALAVVEPPWLSDAEGLLKEEVDALSGGSGFSFGDLAADRAGVRFATAATQSLAAARVLQRRLASPIDESDFFPEASDLPEDLPQASFQREFGHIGSPRYREVIDEIESRLDRCPGLNAR